MREVGGGDLPDEGYYSPDYEPPAEVTGPSTPSLDEPRVWFPWPDSPGLSMQDRPRVDVDLALDRGAIRATDIARPAEGARDVPGVPGAGESVGDSDGGGYKPVDEALRAEKNLAGLLREASDSVRKLNEEYTSEIAQTGGLAEAIDGLAEAVGALNRTVTALRKELEAGRGGGSLPVVAVVQNTTAVGASEDAVSVAHDGLVRKALEKIVEKLHSAGQWLWNMIIHLVTIREWSLGGKLKVPGLAEASLNVTFGG